jgi:hypothetical protein
VTQIDRKQLWPVYGGSPIVAAGPLTKQPYTMHYRHVVRQGSEGQFVVCAEYLKLMDGADSVLIHDAWGNGDYFSGPAALIDATNRFAHRLRNDSVHYQSLDREEDVVSVIDNEIA